MTYSELVEKVQKALASADVSGVAEHIAVQVNVTGEAGGAFYIEVSDGTLTVAPYDYVDRDALLTVSGEDMLAVAAGTLTLEQAAAEGRIALDGNYEKAMALNAVLAAAKPAKKSGRKPAAEKKTTARKSAAKKTADKAEAPAASAEKPKRTRKTAAEKPAKKTAARKTAK